MSWQVAIQASDRLVIGVGSNPDYTFPPETDFGADYLILTIEDDAEVAVLNRPTSPAWISADPPPYRVLAEAPA
jgi:hypothetical protein